MDVEQVRTRAQWRQFLDLPWRVYRDDPHWVPPLRLAEERLLDPKVNPFFRHAEMTAWVVRRGREVVGRVAGVVDQNHNRHHNERTGFFGFFEALDGDAAAALLTTVRDWVAGRGLDTMRGPLSPSINHECGLLVDGFGSSPRIMMTYNPPAYAEYLEKFGLTKARDLHAYWFEVTPAGLPEKAHRVAERARQTPGLRVRGLDLRRIKEEVARARQVFDRAWADNWGFVPLTDDEWDFLATEFRPLLHPDLVLLAEVEGKPVGFLLALPDIYPVLKGLRRWWWPWVYARLGLGWWRVPAVRITLLGLAPDYQNLGLAAILYQEFFRRATALGYTGAEFSWILEDNHMANRACAAMGGRRYKTYRIYEMPVRNGGRRAAAAPGEKR
jgi:GNAT superfamily N-acetyltransferase